MTTPGPLRLLCLLVCVLLSLCLSPSLPLYLPPSLRLKKPCFRGGSVFMSSLKTEFQQGRRLKLNLELDYTVKQTNSCRNSIELSDQSIVQTTYLILGFYFLVQFPMHCANYLVNVRVLIPFSCSKRKIKSFPILVLSHLIWRFTNNLGIDNDENSFTLFFTRPSIWCKIFSWTQN